MDKVSICIPVYNGEKTIRATIVSALAQTYKNIEVIAVDDCSTDATLSILEEFKDERFKIVKNERNQGLVGNWNKCVDVANSDYIHLLCADDIMQPDCIEKKMELLTKNNDILFVFNATEIIDINDKVLSIRKFGNKTNIYKGKDIFRYSLRHRNVFGEPSNILFRKISWTNLGGPASHLYNTADWDLWMRMAARGQVGYISDALIGYRIFSGNETSKLKIKKFFDDDEAMIANLKNDEYAKNLLNSFDIIIHRFVIFFRIYGRLIYMNLFAK